MLHRINKIVTASISYAMLFLLIINSRLAAQTYPSASHYNDSMLSARKTDFNLSAEIGKKGLFVAEQNHDTLMSAIISDNLAGTYIIMGKPDSAVKYINQAAYWYQFCGSEKDILWCRFYLGIIYSQQGMLDTAIQEYNFILHTPGVKEISNLYPLVLSNLGDVYYYKSMYKNAISTYREAISFLKEINDENGLIRAFINLGGTLNTIENYEEAVVVLQEGLVLAEKQEDIMLQMSLLTNLCQSWQRLGRFNDALKTIDRVISLREEVSDSLGLSNSYRTKGDILIEQKEYSRANDYFFKSLKIDEALSLPMNTAATYCMIGKCLQLEGSYLPSMAYSQQGYEIAKEIGAGQEMMNALYCQAFSWSALGYSDEADRCMDEYIQLRDSLRQADLIDLENNTIPFDKKDTVILQKITANYPFINYFLALSIILNLILFYAIIRIKKSQSS